MDDLTTYDAQLEKIVNNLEALNELLTNDGGDE